MDVSTIASKDELILNKYRVNRMESGDLEVLVSNLKTCEQHTKNNAINKLQVISEQVKFLQQQAKKILEDTQRNSELHNVPCNFVKVCGQSYHLYSKKDCGSKFFSMISPQEWGNAASAYEFLGSFRLEYDRSFTPLDKLEEYSEHRLFAEHMLKASTTRNLPAIELISSYDDISK